MDINVINGVHESWKVTQLTKLEGVAGEGENCI